MFEARLMFEAGCDLRVQIPDFSVQIPDFRVRFDLIPADLTL